MAMGSLEDPEKLGRVLAASGFFQDTRDAAQAVVKVLAGAELGFGPIAAMTGVYIVKGRVTLSANLMAACVKRHPKYDFRLRTLTNDACEVVYLDPRAKCRVCKGTGQLADDKLCTECIGTGMLPYGSSEFTMADARTAQLANGENWKKYPRNMLFARAMSNGAKLHCPDAFAGAPVYTPDELGADVDPETGEIIQGSAVEYRGDAGQPPRDLTRNDVSAVARASAPPVEEPKPKPTPEQPAPEEPAPAEPEPEQPAEPSTPLEDPERPVTPEEVAKLIAYLDELGAPESFRTMSRMAHGATSMDALTVGQAHEVMVTAKKRAGTAGWKAATA
jgi:hypothetical protein